MARTTQSSDLDGQATPVHGAQVPGRPRRGEESAAFLPLWLVKELQRAGVSDETIQGLDEEPARELVAEMRSNAVE
jgi:hypothetical protein